MKRLPSPSLVLAALLVLAGCGGHGGSTPPPTLGSASLDLAIAGDAEPPTGVAYGVAMRGTGTDQGAWTASDANGLLRVRAERDGPGVGGRLGQALRLELFHDGALAVGEAIPLSALSGYGEQPLAARGAFQDGRPTRSWIATSGAATVTALSGGTISLSLSGVRLQSGDGSEPEISISGPLSGPLASASGG